MAHSSVGFKGTVDQVGEAKRMALLGPRFRVAGPADWAPTVQAADRTIRIAAGTATACGVSDTTNTAEDIQFAANASPSQDRWDLLVGRWRWTDPITQPNFQILTGVLGAAGPDLTKLIRNPGSEYHGTVLAVRVRPGVGAFAPTDVFDLRVWGGVSGPLVIPQTGQMTALDAQAGNEITTPAGQRLWFNGTAWVAAGSSHISAGYGTDYGSGLAIGTGAAQTGITAGMAALPNLVLPRPTRVTLLNPAVRWNPTVQAVMYVYLNGSVVGKAVTSAGEDTSGLIPTGLDLPAGSYPVAARWEVPSGSLTLVHWGCHFLVADAL